MNVLPNLRCSLLLPVMLLFHTAAQPPVSLSLDNDSIVLQQFLQEVEENRRRYINGSELLPSAFYSYAPADGATLYSIAAECGVSYDTIASFNRMEHPDELRDFNELIVPNMSGLYIVSNSESTVWEQQLLASRSEMIATRIVQYNGLSYNIYPEESFSTDERLSFLDNYYTSPTGYPYHITSRFGIRIDPILRQRSIHYGTDFRAPHNTPIYAVRGGTVTRVSRSSIMGLHIYIQHDDEWESRYLHLSSTLVSTGQRISRGEMIARSGSTGRTRGAHLHFEIRQNGQAVDFMPMLRQEAESGS